ncbi:hypothetical protein, partial [Bacillus cereus group sp. BC60]|uniref:hypothetical protein n=1 Tax=Bacillus cereus group sp. BC60 TaxID=3445283 RepID=UPI003F20CD13
SCLGNISSTGAKLDRLMDAIKVLIHSTPDNVNVVKALEVTCDTCGGPHSYYNCTAIDGNSYEENAIVGAYNQGGN